MLYYYQDQLGSMRALLNGTLQTVAAYADNAFGGVAYKTGSTSSPFGYAGQYTDPETGFQYLQARYYDLSTGQFLGHARP